jgi:cysteine desulfurase family protein (TIGR01976 family)
VSLDIRKVRSDFVALKSGWAYFDGPGGTQTPRQVGAAIAEALTGPLSNRGVIGESESRSETYVAEFRAAYSDLLGVPVDGVVFGRSATQLTYDFSRHLSKTWTEKDEVVVSRIDHDANVSPWVQAANAVGAKVRWIDFDPNTSEISEPSIAKAINKRTKLVAITAASNLLGTKPDVRTIADSAHEVGALVYVDAVHYAAHALVDAQQLGADFVVCSPYKFVGPHCAVLGATPEVLNALTPDKLEPATDVIPERFEFGTLPYEVLAGATAAVDYLASLAPRSRKRLQPTESTSLRRAQLQAAYDLIHAHESALAAPLTKGLRDLDEGVRVLSQATESTPTVAMTFIGKKAEDAYQFLAERKILAPAGWFYAHQPMLKLTKGRDASVKDSGVLRVGLAPYTNQEDIYRLLDALYVFLA